MNNISFSMTKTKEEKRNLGAFYTKSDIITDYMVSKLDLSDGLKILEPCVGDGEFLRALLKSKKKIKIDAYDIDSSAIQFIHKNFPEIKAETKNTLLENENPEYDIILGNPPYGAKYTEEEKKIYSKRYSEINTPESYALFLVNSIKRLKEGGKLSFIISDTFLHLNNHSKLRKFILENCKIKEIILLKTKLFPDVNYQYAGICILTLEKCINEEERLNNRLRFVNRISDIYKLKKLTEYSIKELPSFVDSEIIKQEDYCHFIDNVFFQAGIPKRLLSLFMDDHNKIVENFVKCKTGIYSGNNKRHFKILDKVRETKKFVKAGYGTITEEEVITRNLSSQEKHEGILGSPYFVPLMKGGSGTYYKKPIWFIDWSRDSVKYMLNNPKARVQNSEYYFKKGICMSLINSNRQQARIMEEVIFDQSDNGYFCDERYLFFFLGFFNSRLFNYMLKKVINPTANATVNYVKKIPVLLPTEDNLEVLNNLIKEIISLRRKNEETYVEEKQVDNFFYDLYNLTEEEKKLVEDFCYHLR